MGYRGKKGGRRQPNRVSLPPELEHVNQDAAGMDLGARGIVVAVPKGRDQEGQDVRHFGTFVPDLKRLVVWLRQCGVKTVAMESTGVYWITPYEILEEHGFEVYLVDARKVKNVSGRKSDELDAEWIQKLHMFGLLKSAFRPKAQVCVLRSYQRQRAMLIRSAGRHIQHMHKALTQMGLQLHHVIRDITGVTGMKIVRCILEGQRDPQVLSRYRDRRCKQSQKVFTKALEGNYREEHVFGLCQAVELYDYYQEKVRECDRRIEETLESFEDRSEGKPLEPRPRPRSGNQPAFDARSYLFRITGVDLTRIPGLDSNSVLQAVSETGIDMSNWKSQKHFTSWMSLSPKHEESGGKILKRGTGSNANRAAQVFRLAASAVGRTDTALGAFYRRVRTRRGAPKAITATARKIAVIYYTMLKHGSEYIELGQQWYEEQYRERIVRNLKRRAQALGLEIVPSSA